MIDQKDLLQETEERDGSWISKARMGNSGISKGYLEKQYPGDIPAYPMYKNIAYH